MTDNKIKLAFAGITAEDTLKERTLQYLYGEIQKRTVKKPRTAVKRLAVCAAVCAVLVCMGAFSHNLYYTASAYVDMDVNPSVELAINRFNRVIDAYSYNTDGAELLNGLKLKHKRYDAALAVLVDTLNQEGYMSESSLVSVTLQTDDENVEKRLLPALQAGVTAAVHHHGTAQVDVFPVDHETRDISHQYNISPAKYLALVELMEVDPTATIEGCKHHSIDDIKQQTHSHSETHHGGQNSSGNEEDAESEDGQNKTENEDSNASGDKTNHETDTDKAGHNDQKDGKADGEKDTDNNKSENHQSTSEPDKEPDSNKGHGKDKGGQHHGGGHN